MSKILYYGGNILTMDKSAPRAEAMLSENGRIVALGRYNDLNIAVYGTKGSFVWSLEESDIVTFGGMPGQTNRYRMGRTSDADEEGRMFRLPAGQSEGYYLAFANIYRAFMADLIRKKTGQPLQRNYPVIDDGIESLRFVEACLNSSEHNGAWTRV